MSGMKEFQTQVLEILKNRLTGQQVTCILRNASEENLPMDILTTLHRRFGYDLDEVMGEFYFLPVPDEDGAVHYFTSVISLTEDMSPEYAPLVEAAVSVLNFYLECGAFVVSPTKKLLAFKLVTPMHGDSSSETVAALADLNIAHALDIAQRHVSSLLRLSEGAITLEKFMEQMPQA